MKRAFLLLMVMMALMYGAAIAEGEYADAVPQEFGTLAPEETSDAVRMLQERLVTLGYLSDVSGTYDAATQEAVKLVQTNYGLDDTGVADAQTQEVIYDDCYLPLQKGDENAQVAAMQQRLKELSVFSDEVSGVYGETSEQAIEIFQKMYGIPVTGVADVDTLEMLFGDLSALTLLPTPTPQPYPGTITVNEDAVVKFSKRLAYGSKGASVQKVQERLMELGFFTYHKTTTGYYKNTQAAVKLFQEYNGIPVTGSVDEQTWNALFNAVEVVNAEATPRPTPEPTLPPYFIDVDVKNQVTKVMTLDENNEYTKIVKLMICSTGTTSYPSDLGTWTLSGRTARWCTFPKWGGGTAQYWTKINDSIAFHSVMFADYDTSKLNKKSFNNLGKRASHGCIRLTVPDARWIYENCGAGTQVYIHTDSSNDKEAVAFALYRKTNTSVDLPDTSGFDINLPPPAFRSIKKGAQGEDVTWLQMTLKELGYFEGTVTSHYSDMTVSAVKRFQKAVDLKVDGVFNEKTYNKLYETQLAAVSATQTPVPTT